jgi:hypothetical protein
MLDIQLLRKDLPAVVAGLKRRGFTFDEAAFRALEDGKWIDVYGWLVAKPKTKRATRSRAPRRS